MSLPTILSSGSKGERWWLCCLDSSRLASSSSNLSLSNPWSENEWEWELKTFSCEDGGVRKHDDGEASKHGVKRPNWWSSGDSGVIKQLGSSDGLYFFLWFLSDCSMATILAQIYWDLALFSMFFELTKDAGSKRFDSTAKSAPPASANHSSRFDQSQARWLLPAKMALWRGETAEEESPFGHASKLRSHVRHDLIKDIF